MKKIYILIITLILLILCFLLYREQKIAILGYHSFYKYESELKEINPEYINDVNKFEKQMKYLSDHNYKTLTLEEFYCWKKNKCKFPRKSVVITIDDGNLSNYMYAFPILKKYNLKASVFFIGLNAEKFGVEKGDIYDSMSLTLIEKCKTQYPNISFYSHSYNLHGKGIKNFTDKEIKEDVQLMKKMGNFKYYAYPFGTYDNRIINELKFNNYKMAFAFGTQTDFRKARKSDDDFKVARLNISNYVSMPKFLLRLYSFY